MNNIIMALISLILGTIFSLLIGTLYIPFLRKTNIRQNVSKAVNERHIKKDKTPTMGGVIFVIGTILVYYLLLIFKKITFNTNFLGILIVFILYAILGFWDDYTKIKYCNNKGISIITKLICQIIIAILFFSLFLLNGNTTTFLSFDLKCFYGFFILIVMISSTNAVNITDGLDGLAGGLCFIALITYGILAFSFEYIAGHELIGVFCFILAGSLLGYLYFNFYPAKVFMGDLGSLSLGGMLSAIAITLRCEESLLLVGIIFVFETLSSFFQIISINVFHKKIFLKSPFHHHLEEKGYEETEILKTFYTIEILFCLLSLLIYLK